MSNQEEFQKVVECIINPIKRHWAAEFDSDMVADFVDDLCGYPETTLKKAMERLRIECKRRPLLAHCIEACKANKQGAPAGAKHVGPQPWDIRAEKLENMQKDYLKKFCDISPLMHEANEGKWDLDLIRYVQSVAFVQAQLIIDEKAPFGWDGQVIFALEEITDEMKNSFFAAQRAQAQTGQIDVSIPTGIIDKWKKHAAWREGKKQSSCKNS